MDRVALLSIALVAGCFSSKADDSEDVVGPFTGEVTRYVVDRIDVPHSPTEARALDCQINGDGVADNQLGSVIGTLSGLGDVTEDGPSMIASGAIASVLEIQADSATADDSVGVTYFGTANAPAIEIGGRFDADGFFKSSSSARVPGMATVVLPVFLNAAPSKVQLEAAQLRLRRVENGYEGTFCGAVLPGAANDATFTGILEMMLAHPQNHPNLWSVLDTNVDGVITRAEYDANSLFLSLLAPDIELYQRGERFVSEATGGAPVAALSLGFRFHVTACPQGNCAISTPADTCSDRVLGGDESDIDCGGSCLPCAGSERCGDALDCQSRRCTAGTCEAPSCDDGLHDGFESDVDCGANCAKCELGLACRSDADCASGHCVGSTCAP